MSTARRSAPAQTPVDSVGHSAVTTIEAIGQAPQGAALQKAWLELEVVQCLLPVRPDHVGGGAAEGHAEADG